MATLVLDFDSCLVPVESLEVHAARHLGDDPERLAKLEALTRAGMEGEIDFEDSLQQRLGLMQLERSGLQALGQELAGRTSHGAPQMIDSFQAEGHEVWIVSGGFQEVLMPVARQLGIPEGRVQGVRAIWDASDRFSGLDDRYPFHRSKIAGLDTLRPSWARPAVGVGDGMTDLALHEAGYVDAFIAYVEHSRRQAVLDKSRHRAENMGEVETQVRRLWAEAEETDR